MACLFGHKWDGCKCSKCGKTRNEGHVWNDCICKKCGKQTTYVDMVSLDSEEIDVLRDVVLNNKEFIIEIASTESINANEFLKRFEKSINSKVFRLFNEDFLFMCHLLETVYNHGSARFRVAESLIAGIKSNHELDLSSAESIIKENEKIIAVGTKMKLLIEKLNKMKEQ